MSSDPNARFEFRIWGDRLGAARDGLAAAAVRGGVKQSAETYIVSRATDAADVKIRDGLMDIKLLVESVDGLERWRPVLKTGFPLDSRAIAREVFPRLAAAPPRIDKPEWSLSEFLHDLIQPHRDLAAVDVTKTRYAFTLGACTAEFAEVKIVCGASAETVEIESPDPAALREAVNRLGLSSRPNVSYIRQLKAMTGMTPGPAGAAR